MYILQRLLTHRPPQMTMRYAHLRDDAVARGAGVVDDLLGNAGEVKTKYIIILTRRIFICYIKT